MSICFYVPARRGPPMLRYPAFISHNRMRGLCLNLFCNHPKIWTSQDNEVGLENGSVLMRGSGVFIKQRLGRTNPKERECSCPLLWRPEHQGWRGRFMLRGAAIIQPRPWEPCPSLRVKWIQQKCWERVTSEDQNSQDDWFTEQMRDMPWDLVSMNTVRGL